MNGNYARALATLLLTALIGYGIYQFRDVPTDVASIKSTVASLSETMTIRRAEVRERFDRLEKRLLDVERARPAYDRP